MEGPSQDQLGLTFAGSESPQPGIFRGEPPTPALPQTEAEGFLAGAELEETLSAPTSWEGAGLPSPEAALETWPPHVLTGSA